MTRAVLAAAPVAAGVGLWVTPAVWQTVAVLAFVWWVAWLTGHTARPALARFATVTALASAAAVLWVAARVLADVPWWALPAVLAVPAVLWWHAIAVHTPRPDEDDAEPEPEPEPQRRQIVVRDAGEAGVDVGGIDTAFDYPLEDFTPRTPPPGWVPRSMVTDGSPIVGVLTDDEDDDALSGGDGPLPDRLLAVWPAKPNGDPYASLHAADLAPLVSLTEPELVAELEAAGVCEKVTARPLAVDPVTGKRPTQTGRKGLRHSALHDWAGATARAMP